MGELHQEKALVHQNFRKLRRDFVVRNKDKKQAEKNIEALQRKFEDIQLLKFGQVIDLDLLERTGGNKYVQELTQKVEEVEADCANQLTALRKKIESAKMKLGSATKENTSLIEQITQMGYSQLALDQALNARIANVTVNDEEPMKETKDVEKERMKELLTLQAKEIATLQAEIGLFQSEGRSSSAAQPSGASWSTAGRRALFLAYPRPTSLSFFFWSRRGSHYNFSAISFF